MVKPIVQELDEYRGHRYFLWGEATPDYNDIDEFVANVHYKTAAHHSNVEIARIDTAHGYTHFHQLYRARQPTTEFDGGFWDAMAQLESEWRRYAELYWKNHGGSP